jgi:hypothetical protein
VIRAAAGDWRAAAGSARFRGQSLLMIRAGRRSALFVTPYFVYVHVPKTGGNFMRDFAKRHFEIIWTSDLPGTQMQHVPYDTLPPEYTDLPAISFVRNPWDYYVSQWAWLIEHGHESRMAQAARRSFKEFVQTGVAKTGGGYATSFAGITRGTEVGRYERLHDELLSFFKRHDIPIEPELERDLLESPRINASEHRDYRSYYDDETRGFVAAECWEIIETYGYTFDG